MRKVRIDTGVSVPFNEAFFHQWVTKIDAEGTSEVYAVIEFEDGSIRTIYYERIKFIKG